MHNYIIISKLPKNQQEPFRKWLIGQTLPIIENVGKYKYDCAWKWDYNHWYENWINNKIAEIYD